MSDLEDIGADVRELLGAEGSGARARREQKREFLEMVDMAKLSAPMKRRRRRRAAALVAAVAAAGVLCVVLWLWLWPREVFTCTTSVGESVAAGSWLSASHPEGLELSFSDESAMALSSSTHMRLERLDDEEVRVQLESGSIRASIVPGGPRTWLVQAGPLTVVVLGTVFQVDWSPETRRLRVAVEEGKVAVTGDNIRGGRVQVSAGEHVNIELAGRAEIGRTSLDESSLDDDERNEAGDAFDEDPTELDPPPVEHVQPRASIRPAPRPRAPKTRDWKVLAKQGEYGGAYESATRVGWTRLERRLGGRDLLLLSDVARYTGHLGHATSALRKAHERGVGRAAFLLGRIYLDQRDDPKTAARWFGTYLEEEPRGSLREKAAGLRMEALSESGQSGAARRAARAYLSAHPDGTWRRKAEMLAEP